MRHTKHFLRFPFFVVRNIFWATNCSCPDVEYRFYFGSFVCDCPYGDDTKLFFFDYRIFKDTDDEGCFQSSILYSLITQYIEMDSDDELDDLFRDIGQRLSGFMRRKKARVEES